MRRVLSLTKHSLLPALVIGPLAGLFALAVTLLLRPTPALAAAPGSYQNPILWEDLADVDILRVGDTYYYSASTMHYSPGAPILRSYDLVHWELLGHSVPSLDFGPQYNNPADRSGYVRGVWASFLNYRASNQTFYWGGCIDFSKTYIYTAKQPQGPWTHASTLDHCYYDAGLLIDSSDTMYVAYGNTTLNVAQLTPDGLHEVKTQPVYTTTPGFGALEGSRFYQRNGDYYIFTTHPPNAEYVLRSTHGPFGPYELRPLIVDGVSPVDNTGHPHQGGIVETQTGDWYYMAFIDAFPGGRIPVLAPLRWTADGWPTLDLKDNTWQKKYPFPNLPGHPMPPLTGTDTFAGAALGPQWEWNHNPDNAQWSLGNGLLLHTATVTDDLYSAKDTLTHRILGPRSTATIELDPAAMHDGDRAGLAMFRDQSAWIGLEKDSGALKVAMVDHIDMDKHWQTVSKGAVEASAPLGSGPVWLRVDANITPGPGDQAHFAYSTDGKKFHALGPGFTLTTDWQYFMGYRFGIFNYATQALGGAVTVRSFSMEQP